MSELPVKAYIDPSTNHQQSPPAYELANAA
jgi:hypothetical protein